MNLLCAGNHSEKSECDSSVKYHGDLVFIGFKITFFAVGKTGTEKLNILPKVTGLESDITWI